jgi:integrase
LIEIEGGERGAGLSRIAAQNIQAHFADPPGANTAEPDADFAGLEQNVCRADERNRGENRFLAVRPHAQEKARLKLAVRELVGDVRFHDLRGTAATHFIRAGLPLNDVASIMGWTTKQVEQIARRYVTGEALAAGMLKRLGKNKRGA